MKADSTRLYISPLTSALLPTVLGPSLVDVAQNISYHEIQSSPEHNYGYIELPSADAERLRKKLSGAILKGSKMKVEEARPKKRKRSEQEEETAGASEVPRATGASSNKKKATDNILSGRELSPDRKVKRGWTEPKKEKKKSKTTGSNVQSQSSKFTDKEELLFRTKVPANKLELVSKKSKRVKKTKHGGEESTVHEYEKTTTQPSFLKSSQMETRAPLEYVDGKGWVGEDGAVVEAEPAQLRQRQERSLQSKKKSSSRKTRAGSVQANEEKLEPVINATTATELPTSVTQASVSGEDVGEVPSPSTSDASDVQEERDAEISQEPEIHPLESLFKKPRKPVSQDIAKPSLEISTGFSFFGQDTDEEDANEPTMPLTPFTSQDLRTRGLRSAAPTPDTAHPSRFNSHDSDGTTDDDVEEQTLDTKEMAAADRTTLTTSPTKSAPAVSEFEKMFWEKRGENNRAWKARRRAVLKEKRHRENRARRPKNW